MELTAKIALVTGGGVRVGRALVLALAEAGCSIFLHYGNSQEAALEVQAEVEALGGNVFLYQANLADATATATIIPKAVSVFGQVDILINSASIFLHEDRLLQTDVELWDKIFAINLRAPFQLSQAFAQQIGDRQGKIININDARIPHPLPDHFAYRLTKRGLWDMTEIMALELAPQITVNSLALGQILEAPGVPDPQQYLQDYADRRIPLKMPGNTKVVTDAALYLLEQDFLTGTTITLDGGEYLRH
ncbi:MAG: SDR family oxidoreductase [Snowella sp.]|nr:SDR family oxidoreductase [Snowella sp.]